MGRRDEDFWEGPEEGQWAEDEAIVLSLDMPAPPYSRQIGFPLSSGLRLVAGLAKDGRRLAELYGPGGIKRTVLYQDAVEPLFDELAGWPEMEIAPGLKARADYAYVSLELYDRLVGKVLRRELAAAWLVECG